MNYPLAAITWPFDSDGSASDDTINAPQNLASLSRAGYHFSTQLTNESPDNQVTSAIFGGSYNKTTTATPPRR
jgi:hypothetical protein